MKISLFLNLVLLSVVYNTWGTKSFIFMSNVNKHIELLSIESNDFIKFKNQDIMTCPGVYSTLVEKVEDAW